MSEPRLRAVPPSEDDGTPASRESGEPGRSWTTIALAAALALALVLLVWSRTQQNARIEALQLEVRALGADVAARDRVMDAQKERLDDVRGHLRELESLMDRPLPSIE